MGDATGELGLVRAHSLTLARTDAAIEVKKAVNGFERALMATLQTEERSTARCERKPAE